MKLYLTTFLVLLTFYSFGQAPRKVYLGSSRTIDSNDFVSGMIVDSFVNIHGDLNITNNATIDGNFYITPADNNDESYNLLVVKTDGSGEVQKVPQSQFVTGERLDDSLTELRTTIPAKLNYVGDIFTKGSWTIADSGDNYFVGVGTQTVTPNAITGNLDVSGGNNSFTTNAIRLDTFTTLYRVEADGYFTIGEKSATSYGFGMQLHTGIMWFDMTTGVNSGKLSYNINGTTKIISDSSISFDSGDRIKLCIQRDQNSYIGYCQNLTTNSFVNSITFNNVMDNATDGSNMRTTYPQVRNLGGLFSIDSIHVFSRELKNPSCVFVGTSITSGAFAQSFNNGYAQLLSKHFPYSTIVASAAATLNGIKLVLRDVISLQPTQVVVEIGINDLASLDSNTFKTRYDSLITQMYLLVPTCQRVLHLTTYANATASSYGVEDWLVNFQRRTYGDSLTLFEPYYRMKAQGYPKASGASISYVYDGIHPNAAGHRMIYDEVIRSGKLRDVIYRSKDTTIFAASNTITWQGLNDNLVSAPPAAVWQLGSLGNTRTYRLPDSSGTVALTSQIPDVSTYITASSTNTLTNKSISGATNTLSAIPNSSLTNSTISGISLGSNLSTLTISPPLTGTSYNGSTGVSIGIADAAADGATKGAASFTAADFNASSGNISIDYTNGQAASTVNKGFLPAADFITFNNKIGGSGTTNTIPKFTASGTIGNSTITDNASVVSTTLDFGVGTTTPNIAGWGRSIGIANTGNVGFEFSRTSGTGVDNTNISSFRAYAGANAIGQLAFDTKGTSSNSGRLRASVWNAGVVANVMYWNNTGNILINSTGTDDNINKLQVNGSVISTQYRLSTLNTPPANATDTGTTGEIRFGTDGYLYLCTGTNVWVRTQLATW